MRTIVKKRIKGRSMWIALILSWVLLLPAHGAEKVGSSEISSIRVEEGKNETNVVIEGGYMSYRAFTLESPARLVIDLEGSRLDPDLPRLLEVKGPIVSKIRAGQGDNRSRIVLDSSRMKEPFHFNIGEKGATLLVKCWRPGITKRSAPRSGTSRGAMSAGSSDLPRQELREVLGLDKEPPRKSPEATKIPKYPGKKIHMDFYQADLHNVFRLFGEITGKNFIVDENVKGTLTLSLRDVPWDLAMDIISEMKNLDMEERHDILVVSLKKAQATEGELVVKSVSEKALHPARMMKKEQGQEQRARDLILQAHNLEKAGKNEQALKVYEEAFDLWNKNSDLVKKTAYLHYGLGHYARSYFFSKEALKLNTQDAEAALYAALSAAKLGKKDEAKLFFQTAISAKPKLREAFYNYGFYLEKDKDWAGALYIYKRYEEIFGPSLDVSLAMARVYEGEHRTSESCKKYREMSFSGFSMDMATENMIQNKIQSLCGQGG